MYRSFFKRIIDILVSLIGLIVLSPVFLIIALAIKIEGKGTVIFKQKRLGKDGKEFVIYKFRSMYDNAENMGSRQYSFKDDPRVTRVGRVLRATSMDELPQFINILKGEMSLIGFRPPLTYHPWPIGQYTKDQMKMFTVRPGVTGWAQINGRKGIEWTKRIEMNIWYAENVSFLLDCKIFFMTIYKVVKNKDNVNIGVTVANTENKSNVAKGS